MLRLVAQSSRRCALYARELSDLVDAEGLAKAMTGDIKIPTKYGGYKAGEYIRSLAALEAQERDSLASFAAKAVAAGLVKKQTELAQLQGEMLVKSLQAVLDKVQLTPEQKVQVKAELRALPAA